MKKIFTLTLILLILGIESYSCTVIMVSNSEVVLVGNNEDAIFPITKVSFFPATENHFAKVVFGYKKYLNNYQGGMNEKGLFVDGNSLSNTGIDALDGLKIN